MRRPTRPQAGAMAGATAEPMTRRGVFAFVLAGFLGALAAGAQAHYIELRHASGHPVALVEDGRLVGVCGDEEIYRGILRQTGLAEAPARQLHVLELEAPRIGHFSRPVDLEAA